MYHVDAVPVLTSVIPIDDVLHYDGSSAQVGNMIELMKQGNKKWRVNEYEINEHESRKK